MIIVWRINSANVVVKVSCNKVMSAEILLFNSPTKLVFGLYNIDASYWYGSEYEGTMLDFAVAYTTGTNADGEKIIGFAEVTLLSGTLTAGENDIYFDSSYLVDLFSGTMEQVQSLAICSSSKNSNRLDTMDRTNGKEKLKKFRELNKNWFWKKIIL